VTGAVEGKIVRGVGARPKNGGEKRKEKVTGNKKKKAPISTGP